MIDRRTDGPFDERVHGYAALRRRGRRGHRRHAALWRAAGPL